MKLRTFASCLAFVLCACPQENAGDAKKVATPTTSQPAQPQQQQQAQVQPVNEQVPPSQPANEPAAAPTAEEGKKLYLMGCANCHGPDGTGAMMRQMLPKIGDLTSAEMHGRMKDEDIANLITTGRDKMPPFTGVFKPDQIKSIILYVRTLKKEK